jgi:hypothetical protein
MKLFFVKRAPQGWTVGTAGTPCFCKSPSKQELVNICHELAKQDRPTKIEVYDEAGKIEQTFDYP